MYASGTDQTGTENKTLDKGTRRGHNYNDTEQKPALSADKHTLSNKHGICQFCVPGFSLPCENNLNMWAWQAIHTSSPDCCLPRQTNTEFASFVFNGTCGHGNMSGFGNFCFSCAMPSPLTVSVSANEQRICLFCVPGTRGQKQFFEFGGFVFFCTVLWRLHPSAVEQRICQFCVPGISLPYEYKDDTTKDADTRSRQRTRKFYNV